MRTEEELEERVSWLFPIAVERAELDLFLLGLGLYALEGRAIETFFRLHEIINWLSTQAPSYREDVILHVAGVITPVNKPLAMLLVEGARTARSLPAWEIIPDTTYFAVARAHGQLADYLCQHNVYATPQWLTAAHPLARHEQLALYYQERAEGYTRAGLRMLLLSMLDGAPDVRLSALRLSRELSDVDPVLRQLVRQRLVVAVQMGELSSTSTLESEIAVTVIRTLGQWQVSEAVPFLQEMAHQRHTDQPGWIRVSTVLRRTLAELSTAIQIAS